LIFKYNKGLFTKETSHGNHYLSVSTGVGVMDYPGRWGTDSEIVVLKLRNSN
ncbi:MAG: metallophosphatase, partial [Methanobrevibacter sp.]